VQVVAGAKVERNAYSGFEVQPGLRVAFRPNDRRTSWAAVTRAVRTPTRFDRDLALSINVAPGTPAFARLLGDPGFEAERSVTFEVGHRARLGAALSLDATAFHSRYPNLVSYEPGAPFSEPGCLVLPLRTANGTEAEVTGVEVATDVRPRAGWLVRAAYTFLNMQVGPGPGSATPGAAETEDASPRHQVHLRSAASLPRALSLNAGYRWIARLPSRSIPAYSELDLRLGWEASRRLELAVVGRNLLHHRHAEFDDGTLAPPRTVTRMERSLRFEAMWRW
jgi:iron complex outermembrane receptor protein